MAKTSDRLCLTPVNSCQLCPVLICSVCHEKLDECQCPAVSSSYCNNCNKKRKKGKEKKCKPDKAAKPDQVLVCSPLLLGENGEVQEKCCSPQRMKIDLCEKNPCAVKCGERKGQPIDPMLLLMMHYLWKKTRKNCRPCCKHCGCSVGDGAKPHSKSVNCNTTDECGNLGALGEKAGQRGSFYDAPRIVECSKQPEEQRNSCDIGYPYPERLEDEQRGRGTRSVSFQPRNFPEFRTVSTQARPSTTSQGMVTSVFEPQNDPIVTSPQMRDSQSLYRMSPICVSSPRQHQYSQCTTNSITTNTSNCMPEAPDIYHHHCQPAMDSIRVDCTRCRGSMAHRESTQVPAESTCIRTCKCEKDEPLVIYREACEPRKFSSRTCQTRDTEVQCEELPSARPSRLYSVQVYEDPTTADCQTDEPVPMKKSIIMKRESNKLGFFPRASTGRYYRCTATPSCEPEMESSHLLAASPKKKRSKSNSKKESKEKEKCV